MTQRRMMLIVNPIAGSVARHDAAGFVRREAEALGYDVTVCETTHVGHAVELARQAVAENYYSVVACGGDGTVNEVACGVCGSRVIMGIIPLGSGNGLARHLGIPLTVPGAMKVIAENRILEADYGEANGRPFFCTFGLGFDANVTDKFNSQQFTGRGLINYLRAVFEEILSYKSERYTIIADGRAMTEDAMLVACCNASQYGNNAFIAPHASLKDGLLDVTIVHKGNLLNTMRAGVEVLTGLVGSSGTVSTFQARNIRIERKSEGPAHYDGEPATLPGIVDITCRNAGLRLYSTEKKQKLKAMLAPEIPVLSPFLLLMRDIRFRIFNLFS
ncbi:MAG: diacylglycerol kinase family lipid kinase [Muribaculaceae bacterium]|nr:diacylglycerol kinase family lipid kinase [Muribaculaceae bacterium]